MAATTVTVSPLCLALQTLTLRTPSLLDLVTLSSPRVWPLPSNGPCLPSVERPAVHWLPWPALGVDLTQSELAHPPSSVAIGRSHTSLSLSLKNVKYKLTSMALGGPLWNQSDLSFLPIFPGLAQSSLP